MTTPISLPAFCLVALVGPSGSGKSTFARTHFRTTEVLSSDFFRGLVSDDEMDQSASKDAFELLYAVACKRLARGRLTVLDATHVSVDARKTVVALAREYYVGAVAIVFNVPEEVCLARSVQRIGHDVPPDVIHAQYEQFRQALRHIGEEGFEQIVLLNSPEEIDAATIERRPLPSNPESAHGPLGASLGGS